MPLQADFQVCGTGRAKQWLQVENVSAEMWGTGLLFLLAEDEVACIALEHGCDASMVSEG